MQVFRNPCTYLVPVELDTGILVFKQMLELHVMAFVLSSEYLERFRL